MALFRATSNPQATLKLDAAYRALEQIISGSGASDKPPKPLTMRRGSIREAVTEVLVQADDVLAPHELHKRTARRLGRPVRRHTIDASLSKVVADPVAPVSKVGPGRYTGVAGEEPKVLPVGGQAAELRDRVLASLRSAPGATRPADIWASIEANHGEPVSYDAVANFLSLAVKHPDIPIKRVSRGWYGPAS